MIVQNEMSKDCLTVDSPVITNMSVFSRDPSFATYTDCVWVAHPSERSFFYDLELKKKNKSSVRMRSYFCRTKLPPHAGKLKNS